MKRTFTVLALFIAAITLLSTSCGTSDYVKSLTLSSNGTLSGGFYNLAGVDGTLQLQVMAVYNSGKLLDVTKASTWTSRRRASTNTGSSAALWSEYRPHRPQRLDDGYRGDLYLDRYSETHSDS